MKYLMYYVNGFIKKYPLKEKEFVIGRSPRCQLLIEDDLFSRQHVRVSLDGEGLLIEDLKSTNGTYVDGERIRRSHIGHNGSFSVGTVRFYLKEGDLSEFAPAEELIPIFNELAKIVPEKTGSQDTRYIRDIYREILKFLLSEGLARGDWGWFIKQLAYHVESQSEIGDLFLIRKDGSDVGIVFSVFKTEGANRSVASFSDDFDALFQAMPKEKYKLKDGRHCYCYPLNLAESPAILVYTPLPGREVESDRILSFISQLSKEIELLSAMETERKDSVKKPSRSLEESSLLDIVAASAVMKNLISQAKKIAASDIFVLIHGESGTGKELFARLIHEQSERRLGQFVALNCAAIPENLLEAELFGSERGAYTGAFARKHGKLELASGGTLVLDEIGDMPLTVQTKLLRALQEHEFYRLGGNEPIRVDLRIISSTHRDLKQLISEKLFRNDLYYRLVHHIIHLPPLRERPEDIASLINHFTHTFCSRISRQIRGFSVQTHQHLMNYTWPGNVRQLENEIKRIVSLAEEGEMIGLDLLSEEIRGGLSLPKTVEAEPKLPEFHSQDDLMMVLSECNWSKSEAARRLGMTYQGVHKKLKRLGFDDLVREKRAGSKL